MSQKLVFMNYREFVQANCTDCPIRNKQGCRDTDPMSCSRAVGLVKKQNDQDYQVVVGQFVVTPINQEPAVDVENFLRRLRAVFNGKGLNDYVLFSRTEEYRDGLRVQKLLFNENFFEELRLMLEGGKS